jgi:hypothetical protein
MGKFNQDTLYKISINTFDRYSSSIDSFNSNILEYFFSYSGALKAISDIYEHCSYIYKYQNELGEDPSPKQIKLFINNIKDKDWYIKKYNGWDWKIVLDTYTGKEECYTTYDCTDNFLINCEIIELKVNKRIINKKLEIFQE